MSGNPAVRTVELPKKSTRGYTRAPTMVTEQAVMFATVAAGRTMRPTLGQRLAGILTWVSRLSLPHLPHLPPPRVRYPSVRDYLEPARMSREMDRL